MASEGDYYNECINELKKNDKNLQTMKSEIQVVSSTIKHFNHTLNVDY